MVGDGVAGADGRIKLIEEVGVFVGVVVTEGAAPDTDKMASNASAPPTNDVNLTILCRCCVCVSVERRVREGNEEKEWRNGRVYREFCDQRERKARLGMRRGRCGSGMYREERGEELSLIHI